MGWSRREGHRSEVQVARPCQSKLARGQMAALSSQQTQQRDDDTWGVHTVDHDPSILRRRKCAGWHLCEGCDQRGRWWAVSTRWMEHRSGEGTTDSQPFFMKAISAVVQSQYCASSHGIFGRGAT